MLSDLTSLHCSPWQGGFLERELKSILDAIPTNGVLHPLTYHGGCYLSFQQLPLSSSKETLTHCQETAFPSSPVNWSDCAKDVNSRTWRLVLTKSKYPACPSGRYKSCGTRLTSATVTGFYLDEIAQYFQHACRGAQTFLLFIIAWNIQLVLGYVPALGSFCPLTRFKLQVIDFEDGLNEEDVVDQFGGWNSESIDIRQLERHYVSRLILWVYIHFLARQYNSWIK